MNDRQNMSAYYKKSAFAVRISRYAVTFLFITFLLACILIFGNDITAENIQLLAKYITLSDGSSSLYTDEFSITSNENSDLLMMSDNLVVVRNNNISLLDLSGQKLFSYDYSYSSPAVKTDGRSILVHDIEGTELSVFNTFSKIKTLDFDYNVTCADINQKGLLVVSNEESYRSAIVVYNSHYEEIYRWLSSENYITDAQLSSDGKYVLATYAEAHDGSYSCGVIILDTGVNSITPIHSAIITDELPIKVGYSSNKDSIYVITDSNIHFFSPDLELSQTHKFNQSKIENYYIGDDMIILTERNNLSGKSMTLTGLSLSGNEMFNLNVYDEVHDISIGDGKFFALGSKNVFEFSKSNNSYYQSNSKNIGEKYNAVLCDSDNNCYLTTNTKVKKISFTVDKEQAK